MKYRILGKTGLETSVIGMGTDQFYGEWGQNFSQIVIDKIIDKAHSLGINFIDTAECYGDHLSESFVGNAIKAIPICLILPSLIFFSKNAQTSSLKNSSFVGL